MAITTNLPIQSTGVRGRLDAWMFRFSWMLVALIAMPMLQIALTTAMRLAPMPGQTTFAHQAAK